LGRVALAEHVQVDAVQDKDVHGGSLSLDGSWALNAGTAIVGDLRQYHVQMTVAGLAGRSDGADKPALELCPSRFESRPESCS
jgi:hypothetical protein